MLRLVFLLSLIISLQFALPALNPIVDLNGMNQSMPVPETSSESQISDSDCIDYTMHIVSCCPVDDKLSDMQYILADSGTFIIDVSSNDIPTPPPRM